MATIERIYNIPLRSEWLKAPAYKRGKKAVNAVRQFLVHHMKSENVKIGKYLNLKIWQHGIKNPPHHVRVKVTKDDSGKVLAELVDAPREKQTVDEKVKKAQAKKAEVSAPEVQEAVIVSEEKKPKKAAAPKKKKE